MTGESVHSAHKLNGDLLPGEKLVDFEPVAHALVAADVAIVWCIEKDAGATKVLKMASVVVN